MRTRTKVWLIIATLLLVVGCMIFGGVMMKLKWDFTKLSTDNYETSNYEINENYSNVFIVTDTADVVFLPSESLKTKVLCHEQSNMKHTVTVKDDTLVIELIDTRKWYEHIGINFGTTKITVYIPEAKYGTLSVKASTGDICAENLSAETLEFSVTTGDINVSNVTCDGDVKINVTTGKTKLINTRCKSVISDGSTGDILLNDVVATENFAIERNTGDVKLDGCDAAELSIETDTGNVTGSLLSDKVFIAETDTGSIDVPKTASGGKCKITTDTGNIKIEIK